EPSARVSYRRALPRADRGHLPTGLASPLVAQRPLSDFHPRERLAGVPHTTRRFACRSALALSPDAETLAVVSDQGAGIYEAWTVSAGGGRAQRAVTVPDHALRRLCWSASGELLAAGERR